MFLRILWDKLILEAKREPDSAVSELVIAFEHALEEHREQPLEMTLRLLTFSGAMLRVASEDLLKILHDYNNLRAVRQELEFTVSELEGSLALFEQDKRVTSIQCPHCQQAILLPSSATGGPQ